MTLYSLVFRYKIILDFNVKKSFQLVLDCDAGTLGFIQNGVWLGVAHSNLKVTCLKWRFERGFPFLTKIDLSYREVITLYFSGLAGGVAHSNLKIST